MRVGDFTDRHNYPDPDAPVAEPHRASVLGEFGGFGLMMTGHLWSLQNWGYVMLADEKELAEKYLGASKHVWRLRNHGSLSAAIYTQVTDVETECNGLQTYDRAVSKISASSLQGINHLNALKPPQKIISTNALYGSAEWKYTITTPESHWNETDFDSIAWRTGVGGFATSRTPGIFLNTVWDTADIWLRREFTLNLEDVAKLKLQLFHDEDVEVYLNGVLAYQHGGFIMDYEDVEILPTALMALHSGANTLAVHCHQTGGGQGIDVGIIVP